MADLPFTTTIHGTQYLGHSTVAGVSFHLADGLPPVILANFQRKSIEQIPWPGFKKLVKEVMNAKESGIIRSAEPHIPLWNVRHNDPQISARRLSCGNIRWQWKIRPIVLTPEQFEAFADVLMHVVKSAGPIVKRRLEKAELLRSPSLWERRHQLILCLFIVLALLDLLLFISMFYSARLFPAFVLLTLILSIGILIERSWLAMASEMLSHYSDTGLLPDIARINISRKSVEFFLIIILAMIYFATFGSEAATTFFKFFRNMYGN